MPPSTSRMSRRQWFAGAASLAGMFQMTGSASPQAAPPRPPNRNSAPSQLRITDMRSVLVASNYDYPIIRIDTNQGIYGLGEVRDGGSKKHVLELTSRTLGENPATSTRFSASSNNSAATRGRRAASAAARSPCGTSRVKPTTSRSTR